MHPPYGGGPGSFASQEQLYRQTAVQSVWTSRLGATLSLIAELLRKAAAFVYSCKDVLPNFTVLSPQQALRRMILILAASLLMVVLLTTIDSALLYTYVRTARRVLC
ncbi:hypothetical protein HYH02_008112 [Chlamydomonas schloesseri]|uniref:Uncharacterized protein n=1 Tax=Chlamydomonas schloesseri TaxID=2026947 RepID=A0A835WGL5_9CHLO|nr:hypothetical protein HYH02_008112 [Chlamydomonas schloesseri]|eukprot:KAG2446958.1 hypothetical protein HYH02_008112 [Chlamydomonas schloesseri]